MVVESIFSFANQIIDWLFNSGKVLEFSLEAHKWQADHISIISRINKANKSFKEIAVWHFFAQFFCKFTCVNFHRNCFRTMCFHSHFWPSCFSQFTWAKSKFTIFHFICVSIHQHFQGTIGIWNIVNRNIKCKAISNIAKSDAWIVVFTGHIQVCWNGCCRIDHPCSLLAWRSIDTRFFVNVWFSRRHNQGFHCFRNLFWS